MEGVNWPIWQPRAEKQQYDVWGELNNNSDWTWNGLLPFFKKSELATPPNKYQVQIGGVNFDPSVHGFGGKVKVGFPNFFFVQSELWRKASARLGFPISPDLANGNPHAVGVSPNSLDAKNNTRSAGWASSLRYAYTNLQMFRSMCLFYARSLPIQPPRLHKFNRLADSVEKRHTRWQTRCFRSRIYSRRGNIHYTCGKGSSSFCRYHRHAKDSRTFRRW